MKTTKFNYPDQNSINSKGKIVSTTVISAIEGFNGDGYNNLPEVTVTARNTTNNQTVYFTSLYWSTNQNTNYMYSYSYTISGGGGGSSSSGTTTLPLTILNQQSGNLIATVKTFSDHKEYTINDNTNWFFNCKIKFNLSNNNHQLIIGSQSATFTGLTLGQWAQNPAQHPNPLGNSTTGQYGFTIEGLYNVPLGMGNYSYESNIYVEINYLTNAAKITYDYKYF